LSSLRRAPAWSSLQTDHEALDAVVNKHATSIPGEKEGDSSSFSTVSSTSTAWSFSVAEAAPSASKIAAPAAS
jgi:hypothetical protein